MLSGRRPFTGSDGSASSSTPSSATRRRRLATTFHWSCAASLRRRSKRIQPTAISQCAIWSSIFAAGHDTRLSRQRRRGHGQSAGAAALAAIAALVLLAGAAGWWRGAFTGGGAAIAPIRSIAVLPMDNSADPNEEHFSDGMTEELISNPAQVHALKVISRTSVMRYKKTTKLLSEIARELGADAIIEGSVRRVGGRVRVTAQLIHAASDTHLWAQDFDHDFADVLKLQAEIADAIVREIKVQVTPDESRRLAAARPVNPAAPTPMCSAGITIGRTTLRREAVHRGAGAGDLLAA